MNHKAQCFLDGKLSRKLCNAGVNQDKILLVDDYLKQYPSDYWGIRYLIKTSNNFSLSLWNRDPKWLEKIRYSLLAKSSNGGELLKIIGQKRHSSRND